MDAAAISRCAALIGGARLAAAPVPDLADADRPERIADGYSVQAALHDYFREHTGSTLAGWKIGATTGSMQAYLGVDGPAWGRMMSDNVYENGTSLAASGFCNPGIECEIGLRIGADATGGAYTRDSVGDIVDTVFPAIEIVENRYGDFLARGTPDGRGSTGWKKAAAPAPRSWATRSKPFPGSPTRWRRRASNSPPVRSC